MKRPQLVRAGVMGLAALVILLANVFIASASPFTLTITLDGTDNVNRIGQVTVGGTVTCDRPNSYAYLNGQVTELSGRALMSGSFYTNVPCGPTPTRWTAIARADNGIFSGGQAKIANFNAQACGYDGYFYDCTYTSLPITSIRLKGGN